MEETARSLVLMSSEANGPPSFRAFTINVRPPSLCLSLAHPLPALITEEQLKAHAHLKIVGLVGSIDNDMCMTDLTIGAPTALQRICEAIDNINSTAYSHSRAFVIEVMGRDCGWLALMAGVACVSISPSHQGAAD